MLLFKTVSVLPLLPEIIIAAGAMALLIIGTIVEEKHRFQLISMASATLLLLGIVLVLQVPTLPRYAMSDLAVINGFTVFTKVLIIAASMVAILLLSGFYKDQEKQEGFEFPIMMLFAVVGMMIMVSANSLIAVYMGLELQSLALYVLAAFKRDHLRSSEAGLKYFVLGAVASGIFLYGASMVYGFTGSTTFTDIARIHGAGELPLGALIGLVCVLVAFCFKVSAVPFHMWTPDVYEGAPTPVTAFFAAAPKVAALALFARIVVGPFMVHIDQWQQIVIFVSAASMVVGALGAIRQTNIKRLLAYSSIGHAGYALVGIASGTVEGMEGLLIYLSIYVVMSLGAFGCIMMVKHRGEMLEEISALSGLSKTRPALAASLAILMLSLAGIPPLAGFFGKFFIFIGAINAGLVGLAVIGLLSSVIAAFYYLRVIKVMYFDEMASSIDKDAPAGTRAVVTLATATNLLLFTSIAPLLALAHQAALSLF